ncbi:MAG: glycosyltransferase [Chloroflexi bacterium]|nr:glycosyltransferase [Chloroflexota bacterium]
MNLSIVVCAKNSEKTIRECLQSVERSAPAEIIVIDGNSTDSTVRIAQEFTEKIFSDEGKGIGYARQLGAQQATAEYVSYVDSDVILPEGSLATMTNEIQEEGYIGIHAQVVSLENRSYWEWAEDQHFRMVFNKEGKRKTLGAIAVIYKKSIILKYGFDPSFDFYGAPEDGDLSHRLSEDGHKLGISSAYVYHRHRVDARNFIKQRIAYGKGNALFFWKHKSVLYLFGPPLMLPFGVLVCFRKKSLKTLPYYAVWSLFGTVGITVQLGKLILSRLIPRRSRQLT